jgi:hypothetical protein
VLKDEGRIWPAHAYSHVGNEQDGNKKGTQGCMCNLAAHCDKKSWIVYLYIYYKICITIENCGRKRSAKDLGPMLWSTFSAVFADLR